MSSLLLLALPSALAWEHTGGAWAEDDFPIEWYQAQTYTEDSLEGDPDGEGSTESILVKSWDNWYVAECAAIGHLYKDTRNQAERNPGDNVTTIHWDDPSDEIEPGVLGVTYSLTENVIVKETSTRVYRHLVDADIVFNDNVDFGSVENINAECGGQTSIEAVATHEIGHLHGLAHSCEDGEPCTEADLEEATMFWSVGACDTSKADINVDDVTSIQTLYGSSATFQATTDRIGATPLSVGFEIVSESEIVGANWKFGDGGTSTELNPTHEYVVPGQFTVEAEIELVDPVCGTTVYTYDQIGYVLACEEPRPADGANGFFTVAHFDGLTYATTNHADVSVYGCVDTISWEVYKGTGADAIKPENLVSLDGDEDGDSLGAWAPKITFPEEGDYVVVMNIGGPGGLKASFLPVTAEDRAAEGSGCSTSGTTAGFGLAGLLALAAGIRRRRSA